MRLAKGTRAKIVRQFTSQDRLGDVFEVAECDSESITLSRCYSDSNSYLHEYTYTMPTDEFGVFFEIIGMEEPKKDKKNAKSEALIGDYTETELDDLWELAGSYEDLKALLKLGIKWHGHEKKKERAQREWDQWEIHPITGLPYSVSRPEGKSAKVKVKCGAFVGIASCNPKDVWDIDLGIKLAAARAEVKRTKALANEKMDNLRSIMRQIYGKAAK